MGTGCAAFAHGTLLSVLTFTMYFSASALPLSCFPLENNQLRLRGGGLGRRRGQASLRSELGAKFSHGNHGDDRHKGADRLATARENLLEAASGGSDNEFSWSKSESSTGGEESRNREAHEDPSLAPSGGGRAGPALQGKNKGGDRGEQDARLQKFNAKYGLPAAPAVVPLELLAKQERQPDAQTWLRQNRNKWAAAREEARELQRILEVERARRPGRRMPEREMRELEYRLRTLVSFLGDYKRREKKLLAKKEHNREQRERVRAGRRPFFSRDLTKRQRRERERDRPRPTDAQSAQRASS
jgi:hypothetical protein